MSEIPFAFQWSIDENDLIAIKDTENGRIFSVSVTDIPEFEYYLRICFNRNQNKHPPGQAAWIFLHLSFNSDAKKKVEADYTVRIESANYSKIEHYIFEESKGWGFKVCRIDKFFEPNNKYIIDGKFIVKVNGMFKIEDDNDASSSAADDVEQEWEGGQLGDELWDKDDTKDFTIIVDGEEIEVHKFILSNRSEFFTAMLNSNMKETIENKVEITDFSFDVVETALGIIYNCNFTSTLTIDELISLLQFFDKYQLPILKEQVEPFLIKEISPSNVCNLINASILTNSFKLKEKCIEFLVNCVSAKTAFAGIQTLDKEILFEVVQNSIYQTVETEK